MTALKSCFEAFVAKFCKFILTVVFILQFSLKMPFDR